MLNTVKEIVKDLIVVFTEDRYDPEILSTAFNRESRHVVNSRKEAIQRLGSAHVLHPDYKWNPRHSNDTEIWWKHRTLRQQKPDLPPGVI